jgi:glucokinase
VVLAVCGPIWNNRRSNDANNVRMEPDGSGWPHQHAETIENDLGLKSNSLIFLNDFEAIGYCLAAQVDSQANDLCKSTQTVVLHQVPPEDNTETQTPVACLGAGTGLGACYLSPDGSGRYQVYSSVAGMTDTFSPRSEEEWFLLQYLRRTQSFVEIEQLVSGPAFVTMLQFYSEYLNQPLTSKLNQDLQQVSQDDAPAVIAQYACDYNDALCLRVVDTFLDIFGRVLGTAAQTFLPYRGLYITGGILPKLAWRWQNNPENLLLKSYLDQGPKMSEIVARVPLILINDDDLGLKGCLYYMTIHDD